MSYGGSPYDFPPVDRSPRDLPLIVHQSDLQAWQRCPAEFAYSAMGLKEDQTSASAFGTVVHHAIHVLERYRDLDRALDTFLYFWHPLHIEELTEAVPGDGWLPRQGYNDLRQRGVEFVRNYAQWLRDDDHELLALEYEFCVPLRNVMGVWLAGTVDRLAVRWHRQEECLCIDDLKSGKQRWGLRHNVQGHAYCYASLQPEFWTGVEVAGRRPFREEPVVYRTKGFRDQGEARIEELTERFGLSIWGEPEPKPRRFTWVNLREMRWRDGGYRGPLDYRRLNLAVDQFARSVNANIYPLNISGETCEYCVHRKNCAVVGLPEVNHGAPMRALR